MTFAPIRPDTERRCFAPCPPGTFCECLGRMIPELEGDNIECPICGAKALEYCISVAGPNIGADLKGFHIARIKLYNSRNKK